MNKYRVTWEVLKSCYVIADTEQQAIDRFMEHGGDTPEEEEEITTPPDAFYYGEVEEAQQ